MIVDFHTHIFPEKIAASTIKKLETIASVKAFTDGREESLTASMEEAGVDLSALTVPNFLLGNLLPVTLGNVLGGVGLAALLWYAHLKKD